MRTIQDSSGIPFTQYEPGVPVKIKTLGPSGDAVFRVVHGNGDAQPHFHLRHSYFYVLSGEMLIRDTAYPAGTWGYEPYAAIHPKTEFHDVLYLSWAPKDHVLYIDDLENIPEWMLKVSADVDAYADLVDSSQVPAIPIAEGVTLHAMHVFDARATFVTLLRGQKGARLPARRHLGVTEYWVLSGEVRLADGAVASEGSWIHEDAGAHEGEWEFAEDTVVLATSYGAIVEFDSGGRTSRIIDGSSLIPLTAFRSQPDGDSPDWLEALETFHQQSSPQFPAHAASTL